MQATSHDAARASVDGCPRCGSGLVGAAPSGAPSLRVLELRSGTAPARRGATQWLCRSCGHQWEPGQVRDPAAPDAAAPRPRTSSPGVALRHAREELGQSLSQAAARTRIWDRHLQALESDAPLEDFPAPAYARFFLREYAEYLRLEPDPLIREFDVRHPVVEEAPVRLLPDRRGRNRVLAGVLSVLSITALVAIALASYAARPDAAEPIPDAPIRDVSVHDSGRDVVPKPSVPTFDGMRAVFRLSAPSWIRVVADGETVEARTALPGERLVYRADRELVIRLGNAGAVRVTVNGELRPTGEIGDVVDLGYRWRDGEVHAFAPV
jgi:hypothetical protein